MSSIRRELYRAARLAGDAEALCRALDAGSPAPVVKRAERKIIGRWFGSLLARLTR